MNKADLLSKLGHWRGEMVDGAVAIVFLFSTCYVVILFIKYSKKGDYQHGKNSE